MVRGWRTAHEGRVGGTDAERRVVKKLNCQDVLDQLSDYLEEDVAIELRTQIEAHLIPGVVPPPSR